MAELTSPPGCVSPPDRPSCFRVSAAGRNGRERKDPPADNGGGASGECGEVKLESEGESTLGEGSDARLWLARTCPGLVAFGTSEDPPKPLGVGIPGVLEGESVAGVYTLDV
jgi:hypothetical protein